MDDGPGETATIARGAAQAGSGAKNGDCVPLVVLSSHVDQEGSDASDMRDLEEVIDEMGAVCVSVFACVAGAHRCCARVFKKFDQL